MDRLTVNNEINKLSDEFSEFMRKSYKLFKAIKDNMNYDAYTDLEILRDDIDNFVTEFTNFLDEILTTEVRVVFYKDSGEETEENYTYFGMEDLLYKIECYWDSHGGSCPYTIWINHKSGK